jgi:hypothetical protein
MTGIGRRLVVGSFDNVRYIYHGLRGFSGFFVSCPKIAPLIARVSRHASSVFLNTCHCFSLCFFTPRTCMTILLFDHACLAQAIVFICFCWRAVMSVIHDIHSCCFYCLLRRYRQERGRCSINGGMDAASIVDIGRRVQFWIC